jgi:hypothetical protein
MKHRSVIAFVLLAATLAAVPQVSQDLLELKSALGERARSEMWHAFLSLNGRGGAAQAAPQRTQHTLASCNAPANAGAKKSSAPARAAAQVEATASVESVRAAEVEELAMMLTPPDESPVVKVEIEAAEDLREMGLGRVLKAPTREPLPVREMAMIIPPGEGADPVLPSRLVAAEGGAKAARARARRDEAEARVSYVATTFAERGVEFRKVGDALRFQFDNSLKDRVAIPPAHAAPKGRVTKVKRPQATNVKAPAATSSGQPKHLACLAMELSRADADSE